VSNFPLIRFFVQRPVLGPVYWSVQPVYWWEPFELRVLVWILNSTGFFRFPVEPVQFTGTGSRRFGTSGWEKTLADIAAVRVSQRQRPHSRRAIGLTSPRRRRSGHCACPDCGKKRKKHSRAEGAARAGLGVDATSGNIQVESEVFGIAKILGDV
jgi:hypothetical protein